MPRTVLRYWPIWLACGLVLALAVWIRPRRIEALTTLDGKHRWLVEKDAPARQFAWQPGEKLSELLPPHDKPDDISHPCLADGGRTLYITVRRGGRDADIYRSTWSEDGWQPAEPVTELNTPWDDVGTTVSGDGRYIYLASNRRGGHGGFDLYGARQRASRWGVPKNLDAINSSADDFDPTVSPDALRLCFASKRGDAETSDLYLTGRETAIGPWSAAEPLQRANSVANERSPLFADDGGSLYFAGDRDERRQTSDYNLYRLRLSDPAAGIESLGAGINSPANESDPALSADGFSIHFARQGADGSNSLYQSRLTEVEPVIVWDYRRWAVVRAMWWQVLLAALLFGGLLVAFYYGGGWIGRQASAARFIAASMLVHLAVLWLLLLVPLSQQIVRQLEEVRVNGLAAERFDDNLADSQALDEPAYEKVADLKNLEEVETSGFPRKSFPPAQLIPPADDFGPVLPHDLVPRQPDDRVVLIAPRSNLAERLHDIERHKPTVVRVAEIEPPIAGPPRKAALPEEVRLQGTVDLPRRAEVNLAPSPPEEAERSLPAMVLPGLAIQAATLQMPDASKQVGPPRRLVHQAAHPAMIDSDAQAIQAAERAEERAVLATASPELHIDSRDVVVAVPLDDDLAAPRMPPAFPVPLQPQKPEAPVPSPAMTLERRVPAPTLVVGAAADSTEVVRTGAPVEEKITAATVDLPVVKHLLPGPPADISQRNGSSPAVEREAVRGTLAKRPDTFMPADLHEPKIDRASARKPVLALADDKPGMQAMFALRQGDTRREFIELVGGNNETEAAVKRGLKWLADHQYGDGHWSLHQIDPPEKKLPATSGAGGIASDTAGHVSHAGRLLDRLERAAARLAGCFTNQGRSSVRHLGSERCLGAARRPPVCHSPADPDARSLLSPSAALSAVAEQ